MTVDTNDSSVWPANTYDLHDTLEQLAAAAPGADYLYVYDPRGLGACGGLRPACHV